MKQEKVIPWIIGIVLFLLVLTQLPLPGFPFAVITKIVCIPNTISYWDLNGNILDTQGINNGYAYNITYIPGKLGQAVEFNGTTTSYINFPTITPTAIVMWVKDYSINDSDYYFIANLNGTNYVNGVQSETRQIIPLKPNFGADFSGSVDEIAIFTSLSVPDMLSIYNGGVGTPVCYITTYEENVSCKDYATTQVADQTTGCLNYSGTVFPDCEHEWLTTSGFYIFGSECNKRFYCEDILSTDFSTLALCQAELTEIINETIITNGEEVTIPYTAPPEETLMDRLNEKVFTLAGFEITLLYLIIGSIGIILLLYFTGAFGKK